jgi:hypothetical protein
MGNLTARLVILLSALFILGSIGSTELYAQTSAAIVSQARSTCEKGYSAPAVTALTELIAKEPANDNAYAVRAFCGARRDVKTLSQPDYSKALNLNPRNAFALTVRAFHKSVTDDLKGALEDYDQALLLDPKEEFARVLRERLISENPKLIDPSVIEAKLAALKKEVEASDQNYDAYLKLSDYFREIKRYDEREKYFQSLAAASPSNVCAHYFAVKGFMYNERKDGYDRAISGFDGVRGRRCSAEAAFWVGRNFAEGGIGRMSNEREAYRYYRLALSRDPNIPFVNSWIAKLSSSVREADEAEGNEDVIEDQERIQRVNLRYAEDIKAIQASVDRYNKYVTERANLYDTPAQRRAELLALMKREMALHIEIGEKALAEYKSEFSAAQTSYYQRVISAAKSKLASLE